MNFFYKIFLSVLLIFFINSCSGDKTEVTTIKFWAMGSEAENVLKLVPEFEKRNPGIKVIVQQIPWTAAQEKLITAFASDNTPDACQLGNTWVPQFVSLNALVDLDEWIEKSSLIKKENYFEGIWNTNEIEGKIYGIPWYIDTRIIFYRTDILKKAGYDNPPKDWKELLDVSRKVKSLNKSKDNYPIFIPTNEWATFIIFGLQAGAELLKENNSLGNFSSPEFNEAFSYLIEFHKEKLTPFGLLQVTNIYQAFADGSITIYISGPWNIPEFKKWMKGDLSDKWMTAPLPGYKNEYPGVSLAGGSSLVVFKNSKHKNEVWKFIEYLSESDTQLELYKLLNNLPAVKGAWEDPLLRDDKYMQAFYLQFQNVKATPQIPEWEQIVFSKLQQYAEVAAREVMSIDEALKKLDEDADKILEKRRWLITRD